ncbi:GNAT family N-acetyltransferase [bacterium]|nr:GNAT family N-acetyltransferase [bacterium]
MTSIQIKPIFNQAVPGIWTDFAHIRYQAEYAQTGARWRDGDLGLCRWSFASEWRQRIHNLAFGAWAGRRMVGFIQGDCDDNWAVGRWLYVLPEFQGKHIGSGLLAAFEAAVSLDASSVNLTASENAVSFYRRHGYLDAGDHEFVKYVGPGSDIGASVVPVFHVPGWLNLTCADLAGCASSGWDAAWVNRDHRPMFVYRDGGRVVRGFGVAGATRHLVCAAPGYDAIRARLTDSLGHGRV